MTDILVVTAHPQMAHSRVTRQLMLAAAKLPAHRVHVRDLYATSTSTSASASTTVPSTARPAR